MRIIKALRHPSIRLLWSGQVFSCIGDEVYSIALIWYATELIGLNAGLVAAVQAGSVFAFSLVAGYWVDHHDQRRMMILTDLLRGGAVLLLPVYAIFSP